VDAQFQVHACEHERAARRVGTNLQLPLLIAKAITGSGVSNTDGLDYASRRRDKLKQSLIRRFDTTLTKEKGNE